MSEETKVYGINRLRETWVVKESTRKSMQSNSSTGTRPEEALAKALYAAGLRGYRRNDRRYPGKPDIFVPRARLSVFVHGCFWHGCTRCGTYREPQTNRSFWAEKVARNRLRDQNCVEASEKQGLSVLVFWECQVKNDLPEVVREIMQKCSDRAV